MAEYAPGVLVLQPKKCKICGKLCFTGNIHLECGILKLLKEINRLNKFLEKYHE